MYARRYQHLYTGPYGLVDAYQRTIWLNLDSEEYALDIKKTFESKVSLLVVDLRKFSNFDSAIINSRTCMSWQSPIDVSDIPVIDFDFKTSLEILDPNLLVHCASTFLTSDDRISELQDQILLFLHILTLYSLVKHHDMSSLNKQYIDEIKKIFLVEIHLSEIENKLCAVSRNYLGKSNLPGLVLNTIRSTPYA